MCSLNVQVLLALHFCGGVNPVKQEAYKVNTIKNHVSIIIIIIAHAQFIFSLCLCSMILAKIMFYGTTSWL